MNKRPYPRTSAMQDDVLPTREDRQRPGPHTAKINVIVPTGHFTGSLHHLEHEVSDSSETVLRKLRLFYNKSMTTRWRKFWQCTLLCRKITIETAALEINDSATVVYILASLCILYRICTIPENLEAHHKTEATDISDHHHSPYKQT